MYIVVLITMKVIKNITVPTAMSEVTTEQVVRLLKGDQKNEGQMILNAFDIICDMPNDMVKKLPKDTAESIYKDIVKTLSDAGELRRTFVLGEGLNQIEYGMIPNFDSITLGEFIDLDTFITPAFEGEIKHEEAFKFLSVLYRPITSKVNDNYSIEEYDGTLDWQVMKQCPADVYLNSVAFFLNLRIELLTASQHYIKQLMEEEQAQGETSKKSGVGLEALTHLQEVISSITTKSPRNPLQLASINLPTMRKIDYWLN